MSAYPLSYLFQALFHDGSVYQQNRDDTPQIATPNSGLSPIGSAFTDIANRLGDVKQFGLFRQGGFASVVVDLSDGHFEVNNIPFTVQDPSNRLPVGTPYRLIYFRQVTYSRTGEEVTMHPVEYHIGWQATVDGKNYQQTLAVTG